MSKAKQKVSGRQACIAALRAVDEPLTANEIATAVVEAGVTSLQGKTPKATLNAMITSGAKKGQVFKRVGDGRPARFQLLADVDESPPDLVEALRVQVMAAKDQQQQASAEAKPDPKPSRRRTAAAAS